MVLWWKIITVFLISYDGVYILSHFPLDIIMLCRKKRIHYPGPPFEKIWEGFFYIFASFIFIFYIYITPIIALIKHTNIYSTFSQNSFIFDIIRIFGMILMTIGLILAASGRLARGLYLNYDSPKLITTWGYNIIRHPEYFLYITGFVGLPLITLNLWLVSLVTGIYPYYKIAKYEEERLILIFGQKFKKYQENVGMFIPKFQKH
ncbi:MAG: hypothetical protein DRO88_10110 [Promethearchaeia archaeon]|nr:MAG: hypothetical protein DRO88_10110 [Candidatus Lokiarchaeia archaeon]